MSIPVEIENIEEMRRQAGIDDVELRDMIRKLAVGDFVHLTFLNGRKPSSGVTMVVRITDIQGGSFHGKLASDPAASGMSHLRVGSRVTFTRVHIHSLPNNQPTCG